MSKFLFDMNMLFDILIKRDSAIVAVVEKIMNSNGELFITASMIPVLNHFMDQYKVDKEKFKEELFATFKVISTTGYEVLEAFKYSDVVDTLMILPFKRVCPDGIIVSRERKLKQLGKELSINVHTPEEISEMLNNNQNQTIPLLDLQKEYRYMMEAIDNATLKSISEAKYILGPQIKELESKIAQYLEVKHSIGVSSGTDALVLSLRALAIKTKGHEYFDRDDKIITTPFTFTATGDAILRAGATPVFIDIDPETYNINVIKLREFITQNITKTKIVGIISVHLYGLPSNMDEVMDIAQKYNLFVIEDVAQAFGAEWKQRKVGSIGTLGAFSFFPSKNLGCFGDGGMVATNDDELAELVRMLLKHGGKDKYNVDHIGYNARLDTFQASILLEKIKYIDEFNERRRKIAYLYNEHLRNLKDIDVPEEKEPHTYKHCFHQYTIRVKNNKRDKLQNYLKNKGIASMVYYPVPLHKMNVFEGRCEVYDNLDISEKASKEVLSLPIEPLMSYEECEYIVNVIKEFFKNS